MGVAVHQGALPLVPQVEHSATRSAYRVPTALKAGGMESAKSPRQRAKWAGRPAIGSRPPPRRTPPVRAPRRGRRRTGGSPSTGMQPGQFVDRGQGPAHRVGPAAAEGAARGREVLEHHDERAAVVPLGVPDPGTRTATSPAKSRRSGPPSPRSPVASSWRWRGSKGASLQKRVPGSGPGSPP